MLVFGETTIAGEVMISAALTDMAESSWVLPHLGENRAARSLIRVNAAAGIPFTGGG
jgi:hypothetical protein